MRYGSVVSTGRLSANCLSSSLPRSKYVVLSSENKITRKIMDLKRTEFDDFNMTVVQFNAAPSCKVLAGVQPLTLRPFQ